MSVQMMQSVCFGVLHGAKVSGIACVERVMRLMRCSKCVLVFDARALFVVMQL